MAPAQWWKGKVKAVVSGDTLVIMGAKSWPPPEKQLTLSSLKAPRLGRRDGATKDEPFAWESREFLRKECIGKECVFRTDYKVEQIGNREFGSVFIDKENIALTVVANGWAEVHTAGSQRSPYFQDLEEAQRAAKDKGLGIWTTEAGAQEKAVRELPSEDVNPAELLHSVGKGKPVPGIVEHVISGSLLRITLLPSFQSVMVALAGVQCPSPNRRQVENGAGGDGPEQYALQAKHFTEVVAWHREVRVVLEGVDEHKLFGSVLYPENEQPVDLAQQLVQMSFARVVEWSLNMMTTGSTKLRELERQAKQGRKGIWVNYVPPQRNVSKMSDKFTGTVVEVTSGDCLIVSDKGSGTERRVNLSSLRAPRIGSRESKPQDWAVEAKEFLRKMLIGKDVTVEMEYNRKLPPAPGGVTPAGRDMLTFGNVTFKDKGEEVNASERIVRNGFATVVRHRGDDERSSIYERLMAAEEEAKVAKKKLHSERDAPVHRQNDVSVQGAASRAKHHLPSLTRNGKMMAVCEFVLSGHRLKLSVPKENVTIAFAPLGVRTPQRGGQQGQKEPYADEAYAFTRTHVMQRDVEITVEVLDKGGTFLGRLVVPGPKPLDLGLSLLENGLAKLHPSFRPDAVTGGRNLVAAEAAAREKKLRVWEKDEPLEVNEEPELPSSSGQQQVMEVIVTEVLDGSSFYVQTANEPTVSHIAEQLASQTDVENGYHPQKGSMCLAKFAADNKWYRAYVENSSGESKYHVYFVDFGNSAEVEADRLAPIDPELGKITPQAQLCTLAYVKVPPLSDENGYDAAHLLSSLVNEKQLTATVVKTERSAWGDKHPKNARPKLSVMLVDGGTRKSMQQELLQAGLARLPNLRTIKDNKIKEAVQKLSEYEEEARKQHKGIFMYGDPGDSDDEMDMQLPLGGRGGRR